MPVDMSVTNFIIVFSIGMNISIIMIPIAIIDVNRTVLAVMKLKKL